MKVSMEEEEPMDCSSSDWDLLLQLFPSPSDSKDVADFLELGGREERGVRPSSLSAPWGLSNTLILTFPLQYLEHFWTALGPALQVPSLELGVQRAWKMKSARRAQAVGCLWLKNLEIRVGLHVVLTEDSNYKWGKSLQSQTLNPQTVNSNTSHAQSWTGLPATSWYLLQMSLPFELSWSCVAGLFPPLPEAVGVWDDTSKQENGMGKH